PMDQEADEVHTRLAGEPRSPSKGNQSSGDAGAADSGRVVIPEIGNRHKPRQSTTRYSAEISHAHFYAGEQPVQNPVAAITQLERWALHALGAGGENGCVHARALQFFEQRLDV